MDDRTFVRRALIVLLLVAIATTLWLASHALILLFGAILFAIIIRGLTGLLRRVVPVPDRVGVSIVLLALLLLLGGFLWLFGTQMAQQFGQITRELPTSLEQVERTLRSSTLGQEALKVVGDIPLTDDSGAGGQVADQADAATPQTGEQADGGGLQDLMGWIAGKIGTVVMWIGNALAAMVVVFFGAVFLSYQPALYRVGLRKMVPKDRTEQMDRTMDRTGHALWLWAAGTLAEMILVGVLTGLGLWALGVPAPLALGIIAGVLEFIPYIGPVLAAVPAILLAWTESTTLALWTVGFYVLLQQLEGNLFLPLIQRQAVSLPPLVAIFAILVFASLFGVIGALFAVPLAVAAMTITQELYVKDTLKRPVQGEGT